MITMGSFYSGGIDGFAYAARQVGIDVPYHVEADRRAHRYLKKNYPDSKIYWYDETATQLIERTHIIAGGDPCQPSSTAGNRKGQADHRYRWPFMFKAIKFARPHWVINENVNGSVSNMVLDQKIADLESINYTCQAYNIPAVAINADHERKRIWLIAHSNVQGWGELLCTDPRAIFEESGQTFTLGARGNAFLRFSESLSEPPLFTVADGVPDRLFRLAAAGNSVVPQIPMIFLTAIKYMYNQRIVSTDL